MTSLVRLAAVLFAVCISVADVAAQEFPNRAIRFVLPYAAGGTGDIIVLRAHVCQRHRWAGFCLEQLRPADINASSGHEGGTVNPKSFEFVVDRHSCEQARRPTSCEQPATASRPC
jgi:hypothetical protein